MPKSTKGGSSLAFNRKANFNVAVSETMEAGLVLTGDEIKSIRAHRLQLTGGYIKVMNDEIYLIGLHLSQAANPERTRKVLISRSEIERLKELLQAKGRVAVALDVHLRRGWAKVTIGIGAGRKQHDKRDVIRQRDLERDLQRSQK